MLNLSLRKEFQGKNMPGTTIALHRGNSQGAIDKTPDEVYFGTCNSVNIGYISSNLNLLHNLYPELDEDMKAFLTTLS